jgi:DNA-binding MarR family transcriptional regulator
VRALSRAARLLEHASGDLTLAQYRVLSAVAGGDARASRIARRLALGKPAVSNAVDALCQRGLLDRADSDDQRVVLLHLTAAGRRLLNAVERDMSRWLDSVLTRTGDPDGVLHALVAFGDGIEALHAERAAAR